MNLYLDLLKTLYSKQKIAINSEMGLNIALLKTLSKDVDNLSFLAKIENWLYLIPPIHFFYLLFFGIPKKSYIPKLIKIENEEKSEKVKKEEEYLKLKYDITSRESSIYNDFLKRIR